MKDIIKKAKIKFPRANKMKFDRTRLEQASSKYVAEYRTWKMRQKLVNIDKVLEVGSGIGGDTIAMSMRWKVITVEKNHETMEMLKHNLRVYNLKRNVEFVLGDINKLIDDLEFKKKVRGVECIFFDPSRRNKEVRTADIEEYEPPLSILDELKKISPNICVKISPGVYFSRIKYDCDIEVVSCKGEVKEAVLWFGGFKISKEKRNIIATKLPEKITWVKKAVKKPSVSEPKKYLYEPDPAFIKANLIDDIADKYGLSLVNKNIVYMTDDKKIETPILKRYKILKHTKLDYASINEILENMGIGKVHFKSRGVPVDMENIHKSIKGKGEKTGLVVLTKLCKVDSAIICEYDD